MNAVFLELLCCTNAFPSGGDFNEDAVTADAFCLIECDEVACFGDGAFSVKREAGINFSRYSTWDDLEDF